MTAPTLLSLPKATEEIGPASLLAALPLPVLALSAENEIDFANPAAEQFFAASLSGQRGLTLDSLFGQYSPVIELVNVARRADHSVAQSDLPLDLPRVGERLVSLTAARLPEAPHLVVLTVEPRGIARKLDSQLSRHNAARSVSAMASILAHEVKNPISGIRGAAQLLESELSQESRPLAELICSEADRIADLVDGMELFADDRPIARSAVNIHEVLNRVRRLAASGFAKDCRILEVYDPSLPAVLGNRDHLIQAVLNLVKNAAEAIASSEVGRRGDGSIVLRTRFEHGLRLALPGGGQRVDLPLTVWIQDNGPGIPDDMIEHLFEPFVSTKAGGRGLGLSLVAKTLRDHGGVIEVDSRPGRTVFRLHLPQAEEVAEVGS